MKRFDYEWLYLIGVLIAAVVSLTLSYFIAISDLPDWVKFFLLK